MKKIIVAIDGLKYQESTVQYAALVARQEQAHLVAVFLDDFLYHGYTMYALISASSSPEQKRKELEEKDKAIREKAAASFEKICRKEGLEHSIHHDRNIAIGELLHESIYADLIVINSQETLARTKEKTPTHFIRDLLEETQCAVLVVPISFKPFQKLVLLYDGAPSSVYALRAFSYILPSFKKLPAEVVSVNDTNASLHLAEHRLMKEFMKRHYPAAVFSVFKGNPETEIVKYLGGQEGNILIVLGAYHRGMVSRWFRSSMADVLMKNLDVPLFIAHNT
jgi:nucleotide-binding universal stress UspA family protein